jgi:hypothetical protein
MAPCLWETGRTGNKHVAYGMNVAIRGAFCCSRQYGKNAKSMHSLDIVKHGKTNANLADHISGQGILNQ